MKTGPLMLFHPMHCNNVPIKGAWVLASWHWPSSITWRWALCYSTKAGPVTMGFYKIGRMIGLNTKRLGAINFQWQDNVRNERR